MKAIGSRSTTGSEAILIAAIKYWLLQHSESCHKLINILNTTNLFEFTSKVEYDLGLALDKYTPLDNIISNFWKYAKNDSTLKFMIECAFSAQKDKDIKVLKEFCRRQIISEFGHLLKTSKFYRSKLDVISKLRNEKRKKSRP